MTIMTAQSQSFAELRRSTGLPRARFAREAQMSDETVLKMEQGKPVSREYAYRALRTLNGILGTVYTLDDVDIVLSD